MSDPPAPPQVSADGKFYWDGTRWVPMQGAPPAAVQPIAPPPVPSHRGRNFAIGCLALIVLLVVIGIAAGGGNKNQTTLKWTVDGRSTQNARVGGTADVQVTVTNNGTAASNFIIYLNAKDDWFKHHVITDPDGCTINKNLERLDCGSLAAGATKTINVSGSPKDAGNFDFEAAAADQEGSDILYPEQDGVLSWSETVTQ